MKFFAVILFTVLVASGIVKIETEVIGFWLCFFCKATAVMPGGGTRWNRTPSLVPGPGKLYYDAGGNEWRMKCIPEHGKF